MSEMLKVMGEVTFRLNTFNASLFDKKLKCEGSATDKNEVTGDERRKLQEMAKKDMESLKKVSGFKYGKKT